VCAPQIPKSKTHGLWNSANYGDTISWPSFPKARPFSYILWSGTAGMKPVCIDPVSTLHLSSHSGVQKTASQKLWSSSLPKTRRQQVMRSFLGKAVLTGDNIVWL
jgi:hypothetical protein